MEYLQEISHLPFPTLEQIEKFQDYVLNVHSWYKRLSLQKGGIFVVFIEPDLNREYPKNRQIYPLIGNTKEEYQKAFGHLSYMWYEDKKWNQDYGPCRNNIPQKFTKKWSFTLYPYCHNDFEESINYWAPDLNKIKDGFSYPNAYLLTEWQEKALRRNEFWQNNLNEAERNLIVSNDCQKLLTQEQLSLFNLNITNYYKLEMSVWLVEDTLRNLEIKKLNNAIHTLIEDIKNIKNDL